MRFDKKEYFSIRKTKLGVGSVLLGFAMIGSTLLTNTTVSANEVVETVPKVELVSEQPVVEETTQPLDASQPELNTEVEQPTVEQPTEVVPEIELPVVETEKVEKLIPRIPTREEAFPEEGKDIPTDLAFRSTADAANFDLTATGDESVKLKDNQLDWRLNVVVAGQDFSAKGLKLKYSFEDYSNLRIEAPAFNDKRPSVHEKGGVYKLGDVISGSRISIPLSFSSISGSRSGEMKLELLASDDTVIKTITKPYAIVAPQVGPLFVEFNSSILGNTSSDESVMGYIDRSSNEKLVSGSIKFRIKLDDQTKILYDNKELNNVKVVYRIEGDGFNIKNKYLTNKETSKKVNIGGGFYKSSGDVYHDVEVEYNGTNFDPKSVTLHVQYEDPNVPESARQPISVTRNVVFKDQIVENGDVSVFGVLAPYSTNDLINSPIAVKRVASVNLTRSNDNSDNNNYTTASLENGSDMFLLQKVLLRVLSPEGVKSVEGIDIKIPYNFSDNSKVSSLIAVDQITKPSRPGDDTAFNEFNSNLDKIYKVSSTGVETELTNFDKDSNDVITNPLISESISDADKLRIKFKKPIILSNDSYCQTIHIMN